MAKLNFYDTDAVKAFVLDILIENAELKSDLDYEKKCSNDWFDRYKKADQQVKDLEAKVATGRIKRNHGHSGAVCGHCRK